MQANISEIKCPIPNPSELEHLLIAMAADFKGEDHQKDTYFKVADGRLKLREGNIENTLIRYHRAETKSIKQSKVLFQPIDPGQVQGLKSILSDTLGILKIVTKKRKIYFIDNVKFHIDEVNQLGNFIEIEAIDQTGLLSDLHLKNQCQYYIRLFKLDTKDFVNQSYSDMIPTHDS